MENPRTSATPDESAALPERPIALVNGFWGQNIGNAFFNLGGEALLNAVVPMSVGKIQDAPAYWTLHRKSRGNFPRAFFTLKHADIGGLVLQGPVLTTYVNTIWEETLKELSRRSVPVILLGVGFFRYTEAEREAARMLLQHQNIVLVTTRDDETFDALRGIAPRLVRGIDSAFFLPEAYQPITVGHGRWRIAAVDQSSMPRVAIQHGPDGRILAVDVGHSVLSRVLRRMTRRLGAPGGMLRAVFSASPPKGWLTVTHRTNPHLPFYVYRRPDAVAADEPYTYLNLYASAEVVVTDRVHAVVAATAYGTPSVFVGATPRASLLPSALGAGWSSDELFVPRPGALDLRKREYVEELQNHLPEALLGCPSA